MIFRPIYTNPGYWHVTHNESLTGAAGAPDSRQEAVGEAYGAESVLITGQLKHLSLFLHHSLQWR